MWRAGVVGDITSTHAMLVTDTSDREVGNEHAGERSLAWVVSRSQLVPVQDTW